MGLKSLVATFIQTKEDQSFTEKSFDLLSNIYHGLMYNHDKGLPWDFIYKDADGNIDFAWICIGEKYIKDFGHLELDAVLACFDKVVNIGKIKYSVTILTYTSLKNENIRKTIEGKIQALRHNTETSIEVFDIYDFLEDFTNAASIEISDKITYLNQRYKKEYQKIMEQRFYIETIPYKIGDTGKIRSENVRKVVSENLITEYREGAEFFQRVLSKNIFETNPKWLFVLSEFGFGKTSLLLNLSDYLIDKNLSTFYIPFARLSNDAFADENSLCRTLLYTLLERPIESSSIFDKIATAVLKKMLKNRQDIVLLFDGLDEFSHAYKADGLKRIFDVLKEFSSAMVLTIRKEFWDDKQGFLLNNIKKKYSTLFLTDWTNKEIEEYANKYITDINDETGRENIQRFIKTLNKNAYSKFYGDIPRRPLFLEMILKDVKVEKVTKRYLHELYEKYLIDKYKRDRYTWMSDVKNSRPLDFEIEFEDTLLTVGKIFRILEVLSSKMMFNEQDWSITYIPTISESEVVNTAKFLKLENLNVIDLLLNSVLVSYDKRNLRDFKLRFAHKSFQEYFVARYLVSVLQSKYSEQVELDWFRYSFSKGLEDFLFGMIDKMKQKDKIEFENCLYTIHTLVASNDSKSLIHKIRMKYVKPHNFISIQNRINRQKTYAPMQEKSGYGQDTLNQEVIESTIGIVTALPKEFAAMKAVLDTESISFEVPKNDNNDYAIGYIKRLKGNSIKVVVALMKEMGTNNAASTTTNILRSFPEINDIIICGIAGGVPNISKSDEHVRLGDIVVSDKNGILQYDNVKETDNEIKIRDASQKPSSKLLGIVNLLIAEYERNKKPWIEYLQKYEGILKNSNRPTSNTDLLLIEGNRVKHPKDKDRVVNEPKVFHGPIGSANTLLKNEKKRDFIRDKFGVKAIEMEGSGIADGTWSLSKGYLIVRGIVDYCNMDKSDVWHNYAALCAACYTKCIIERL